MTRTRLSAFGAALALRLCVPHTAYADGAVPNEAAADALFQEGRALLDAGKYAEAVPKFVASQRLDPGVGTLLNLAFCQEQLGKTASAWTAYLEAAAAAHAKGETERERIARAHAAALEPLVPKVTVAVATQTADLDIVVDGQRLPKAALGAPMPVDPGAHQVEAKIQSRQTWSATVEVDAQHQPVVLVPILDTAPPPAAPHESAPRRPDERWRTPTMWALGATGVVALGLDAAFLVAAQARYSASKSPDVCNSALVCTPAGAEARKVARDYGNAALGTGIAGGALLGTAAVLWLTAPKGAKRTTTGTTIDPVVSQNAWGLSVTSSW